MRLRTGNIIKKRKRENKIPKIDMGKDKKKDTA